MGNAEFIGRIKELDKLNGIYRKTTSSLVVVRGRRRVGKSRLISEFLAQGVNCLKFSGLPPAKNITAQTQREHFANELCMQVGEPKVYADDWGSLFTYLGKLTKDKTTVIVFDEISWMAMGDETFLPKLKNAWDDHFNQHSKTLLILCGSVSSWIENNIMSNTGFFGRISQEIVLNELDIKDSIALLKARQFKGSVMETCMVLSITGGIPWYIEQFEPGKTALANIKELCFSPNGTFVVEFEKIFNQLFGKRSAVFAGIIKQIVDRKLTRQEIIAQTEYSNNSKFSEYLHDLVISGYIESDNNWEIKTGKAKKQIQYRLKDNFIRFYLKNIEANFDKIQRGYYEDQSLESLPNFGSMMGLQFENLVLSNRKIIWQSLGINSADLVYDNPYFQKATKSVPGCQIDYLIQTKYKTLFACEIKFSKNPVGVSVIEEVKQKIARLKLPKTYSCFPVLIHVNGVTDELENSDYFMNVIDFSRFIN